MERIWASRREAVFAAVVGVLALALAGPAAAQPSAPAAQPSAPAALSLQGYLDKVAAIVDIRTIGQFNTVRAAFDAEAKTYETQFRKAAMLQPPSEIGQSVHRQLVGAFLENVAAFHAAAVSSPADAPNTDENSRRYGYRTADIGYARGDQAEVLCAIRNIARKYGARFQTLGDCDAAGQTTPGTTAGSKEYPVNDVLIVHGTLPGFIDDRGNYLPRPNVNGFAVSSIFAKAGRPLTITFDNRNPPPFQFNIAIYRGDSTRVAPFQLVDGTIVVTGEKVHVLTVTLPPGVYTYVDNVHPGPMRGKLTIVR